MGGHLKVTKIYDDYKEVVVDDSNMLVRGLVVDIVSILTGEAVSIPSITPGYLQLGVSGMNSSRDGGLASGIFYHLSAPLSSTSQYGDETTLELQKLNRSFLASTADSGTTYSEMLFLSAGVSSAPASSIETSSTSDKHWFIPIPRTNITKTYLDSVEVSIVLDKDTANGILLREFGLFSKNPIGYKNDKPLLVAYKQLSEPLTKRSEFKLLIEWSIGFLGNSNIYDNITPGVK